MVKCKIDICINRSYCLGFCSIHYQRFRKWGDPLKTKQLISKNKKCVICKTGGKPYIIKGYCSKHYAKWRKYGDPKFIKSARNHSEKCKFLGCNNNYNSKGFCGIHYNRFKTKERKQKIISYYSRGLMVCACCGEKNIEFLTLDHINNNGAQHRKQIGMNTIYNWIIKNNYPSGFQVLCMNCNWGKSMNNNICPHNLLIL